jgi:hypothetical protein
VNNFYIKSKAKKQGFFRRIFNRISRFLIDQCGVIGLILLTTFVLGWVVGYCKNLYKLFSIPGFEGHAGEVVGRALTAVIWPLGGFAGWF